MEPLPNPLLLQRSPRGRSSARSPDAVGGSVGRSSSQQLRAARTPPASVAVADDEHEAASSASSSSSSDGWGGFAQALFGSAPSPARPRRRSAAEDRAAASGGRSATPSPEREPRPLGSPPPEEATAAAEPRQSPSNAYLGADAAPFPWAKRAAPAQAAAAAPSAAFEAGTWEEAYELRTVVEQGEPTALATLLQQPSAAARYINAGGRLGWTPLHSAAAAGNADVVALLLAHGADATARTRVGGDTPLHLAAASGHAETCAELCAVGGDDLLTARNKRGLTPIEVSTLEATPLLETGGPRSPSAHDGSGVGAYLYEGVAEAASPRGHVPPPRSARALQPTQSPSALGWAPNEPQSTQPAVVRSEAPVADEGAVAVLRAQLAAAVVGGAVPEPAAPPPSPRMYGVVSAAVQQQQQSIRREQPPPAQEALPVGGDMLAWLRQGLDSAVP